jgi:translation initiation factor IF-3
MESMDSEASDLSEAEINRLNEQNEEHYEEEEPADKKVKSHKNKSFKPATNKQIPFETINYIDLDGKYHSKVALATVLQSFSSRVSEVTLALVDPDTATCRLFLTKHYHDHMKKMKKKVETDEVSVKTVQLTWNIGDNDLDYRLRRAVKHLGQGGRLDIMFGARKAKLVRTRAQRESLLERIRATLGPYGYEWKEMTGGFPNAEMWFQGVVSSKTKPSSDTSAAADAAGVTASTPEAGIPAVNPEILGDDKTPLTRGEFKRGFRNREEQQKQAATEYRKAFPTVNGEAASRAYWEKLATSASDKTLPSKSALSPVTASSKKTENNESEPSNVAMSQDKLRSVAAQFAKIGGSKSLFSKK